ncbi:hypothetical protein GUJ93_ZPchr0006g42779 [Zizania palustris]|uniref:Uncharacterized protein n=1 Tax=Zizania palustris TaxID=103762 RepID=A0A8J5VM11_ZIZPA|nr:hypothetical protein GUJ93_ZPchr0006g42779 [Zizania palustris]
MGSVEIDGSNIIVPTLNDLFEEDRVELDTKTRELHVLFLERFTKTHEGFVKHDIDIPDLLGSKVTALPPRLSS